MRCLKKWLSMGRRVDLIRKRLGQPMATKPSILTSKKTPRSWRRCSSTPVGRGKCRSLLKEAKLSSDTGVVEEYDRWQFAGITRYKGDKIPCQCFPDRRLFPYQASPIPDSDLSGLAGFRVSWFFMFFSLTWMDYIDLESVLFSVF